MTTDPIADMLIRLKNASRAKRASASVPYSRMKEAIADLLVRERYIKSVDKQGKKAGHRSLEIELIYSEKKIAKIIDVERISKQGRRVYLAAKDMHRARRGIIVVSTSEGLLTAREAKKKNIGGEVLFAIE